MFKVEDDGRIYLNMALFLEPYCTLDKKIHCNKTFQSDVILLNSKQTEKLKSHPILGPFISGVKSAKDVDIEALHAYNQFITDEKIIESMVNFTRSRPANSHSPSPNDSLDKEQED